MSALIRQSHANNEQPLWISSSGGGNVVAGNLVVDGSVTTQDAGLILKDGATTVGSVSYDTTNQAVSIQAVGLPVATTGTIEFSLLGASAQTYLDVTSIPNSDLLMVGGQITTQGDIIGGGDLSTGNISATSYSVNIDPGRPSMGVATLVNGLITVPTGASDVTSIIFLTRANLNASTALGELRVRARNSNDFQIEATNPTTLIAQAGDQSDVQWIIFNGQ